MRRSWPAAHITLACNRYNSAVVARNPDVDALAILEAGEDPRAFGRRLASGLDLAIALAPRALDFEVVGASRARRRIGYTYVRRYMTRLFARRSLTDLTISEADPELAERDAGYVVRHEVDQILALVERAGGQRVAHDLVLPVEDADRALVAHIPPGGIAVQLAPRWLRDGSSPESTLQLLADLRRLARPVVATYGSDALPFATSVAAAGGADLVVGDLPFAAWAAASRRAPSCSPWTPVRLTSQARCEGPRSSSSNISTST